MAAITVRNLPDEVHRALRLRAANHGRSTEAEVREILAAAVRSDDGPQLGKMLSAAARRTGVTNADVAALELACDRSAVEPPALP